MCTSCNVHYTTNAIIETGFNAYLYRAATHECTFTTLHVGLWNMHCLKLHALSEFAHYRI